MIRIYYQFYNSINHLWWFQADLLTTDNSVVLFRKMINLAFWIIFTFYENQNVF